MQVKDLQSNKYTLVQTDIEVESILESIGIESDYCSMLIVKEKNGEYVEVYAINDPNLDSYAESLI